MADIKITDLAAYTDPVSTDVLPIVDVGGNLTKKVSIADLLENAGTGSAAAPSLSFDGDNNTGIYQPGVNEIAITTNGTQRLLVNGSGSAQFSNSVSIGGTLPASPNISLNANGTAEFAGSVEAGEASTTATDKAGVTLSNAGNVLVQRPAGATSSSRYVSGYNGNVRTFSLNGDGSATFAGGITQGTLNTNQSTGDGSLLKNNGGIVIQRSGGNNGTIIQGYNGTTRNVLIYSTGAAEFANNVTLTGGTQSSSTVQARRFATSALGTNSEGKLQQNTGFASFTLGSDNTAGGSSRVAINLKYNGSEVTKLNYDGSATFAGSVSIGGTAAANTIDEYEEGTWTATITADDGSSQTAVTLYSSQYVKVGKLVTLIFQADIDYSVSNQKVRLSLPFAPASFNQGGGCLVSSTTLEANTFNFVISGTTLRGEPPSGYTGTKSFRGSVSYYTN